MPGLRYLSALALLASSLYAQPAPVGPLRFYAPEKDQLRTILRNQAPSRRAVLPRAVEQVLHPLTRDEIAKAPKREGMPLAGVHRKLDAPLSEFGRWDRMPDGSRVWRAAIHSPAAAGLRIEFARFDVGAGRVWIHSAEGAVDGPYTARGLFGDGAFWTETLFGNSVTVEYEPASSAGDDVPFEVRSVAHVFPGYFDVEQSGEKEAAAPCHLDVACYPDWADTARSEARLVFEKDGGSYFCSGTLLNTRNSSRVPYFLTANHCIDTDAVARTVQAFWLYQAATCNGNPPNTRDLPRSNGARLLATGDENQGDYTLLQLTDVPNGVFFSGWNAQEVASDANLTGIHHPAGDYKRISFGQRRSAPSAAGLLAPNVAYTVTWTEGHTEGGSSGSGLFSAPGVLVGTLTGGLRPAAGRTKCDINPDSSFYGRFSSYYPAIRDYLEDRTTTAPTTPPTTPTAGTLALTSGVVQNFSIPALQSATLLTSPAFSISVPAGATRLTVRMTGISGVDLDLFVRFGTAPALSGGRVTADYQSTTAGANESIVIDVNSNPSLRAGTYFISIAQFTTGVPVQGTMIATIETGGGTAQPPAAVVLTSGVPRDFTLPSVTTGTLFTAPTLLHSINVPTGATRLTIRVQTATPKADVDLYVRYGQSPVVQNEQVVADFRSISETGDETVVISSTTNPVLRGGTYVIALALYTRGVSPQGTITATVETGSTTPGPATGGQPVPLTSGVARDFQLASVTSPTLFNVPASMFTIQVPQNATRLTIRLTTATAGADLDLFARFGSAPELAGSRVTSDHSSTSDTGNESITVTTTTTPPLRAGTYYIALALFTTETPVRASIVATLESSSTTPPNTNGPVQLTSGSARPFTLAAVQSATLLNAQASLFTVQVPQGATRLQVRISTATPNVDVDLYVNYNSAPRVVDGRVQSDHRAETDGTGNELIVVNPSSNPGLRAGTYYIAMALFTRNTAVNGTITATVDTPSGAPPTAGDPVLISGQGSPFQFAAVQSPTLFTGSSTFRITVPQGASRLQLRVTSADPTVDVDLYARYDAPPEVQDGNVVADHASESETGNETISITSASNPPLRPGVYYIALSLYSIGSPASGILTATIDREVPTIRTGSPLEPGRPITIDLPAVARPTFYSGNDGLYIEVPEGAPGLRVQLQTDPGNVDIDLFVRQGQQPDLVDGRIVSDYRSTGLAGDELVTIGPGSLPPLRAGVYFIALANYTTGAPARVQISADFDSVSDAPEIAKESTRLRKEKPEAAAPGLDNARAGVTPEVAQ